MTETVYRERTNARWEFWTYSDGQRIMISETTARLIVSQGGKQVDVD